LVGALARVLFSKARAVEGAEPSSRSAEREIFLSALSFCKLFLCAYMVKEKATKGFVQFEIFVPLVYTLRQGCRICGIPRLDLVSLCKHISRRARTARLSQKRRDICLYKLLGDFLKTLSVKGLRLCHRKVALATVALAPFL
ncbi:MAG: hypothetical protein IJW29_09945, partial [Clostridia bacterium]|nr:hypothetical protein [Clostridia bacterium]